MSRRSSVRRRGVWIGTWTLVFALLSGPIGADASESDKTGSETTGAETTATDGQSASDLTVTRFMVFVPAKDFALSKRFYLALGSELVDDGADYAEFRWGDDRFIVSDEYQAQWAKHFAVHVIVKDTAAFARRARELVATGEFPGVHVEGPKEEPWGYRVTYVRDPSGVSLRFSEPVKH